MRFYGLIMFFLSMMVISNAAYAITIETFKTTTGDQTITNAVVVGWYDLVSNTSRANFIIEELGGGEGVEVTWSGGQSGFDALNLMGGEILTLTDFSFGTFNGMPQASGNSSSTVQITGSTALHAPNVLTIAEVNSAADDLLATRIEVTGEFVNPSGTFNSGTNYDFTDGLDTTEVRIDTSDLSLFGETIPTGQVSIIGVLDTFNTSRRIIPMQIIPEPASLILLGVGATVLLSRRQSRLA